MIDPVELHFQTDRATDIRAKMSALLVFCLESGRPKSAKAHRPLCWSVMPSRFYAHHRRRQQGSRSFIARPSGIDLRLRRFKNSTRFHDGRATDMPLLTVGAPVNPLSLSEINWLDVSSKYVAFADADLQRSRGGGMTQGKRMPLKPRWGPDIFARLDRFVSLTRWRPGWSRVWPPISMPRVITALSHASLVIFE